MSKDAKFKHCIHEEVCDCDIDPSECGYYRTIETTRRTKAGLCAKCTTVLLPWYEYCPKCGNKLER